MKRLDTDLPGVHVIETEVHRDSRGYFQELYHRRQFDELGLEVTFVQDNMSWSRGGVVRGLHYQEPRAQGKLVSVFHGAIFDVAVDIRPDSPTFRKWVGVELRDDAGRMLWIAPGFAHGFATLADSVCVNYKVTDYWNPETEHSLRWDDPELAIQWPVAEPLLSEKDAAAPFLNEAAVLPTLGAPVAGE